MRLPSLLTTLLTTLLTSAVVLLPASPSSAAATAARGEAVDREKVDGFVEEFLDRNGLPGAAVALVHDGRVALTAGYGTGSDGRSIDGSTRMRIASVSKAFTAFVVLQLVDDGLVDLDRPVSKYVDLTMADRRADRITVRQLLSHTSGIPSPTIIGPADSLAAGVDRLSSWELEDAPGRTYRYSNANYWVAARVVEKVTGRPFASVLRDRVFRPLAMEDTETVTTTGQAVDDLANGHVTAYGRAVPAPEPEQMVAGSGGIVSTADDLAAWLAMQQRDGRAADGRRLLSAASVREAYRPQPRAGRAGLGWVVSADDTPRRLSTSGVVATFNAQQDLVPSSGYGVVVLLPSSTPTREQAYALSTGLIDITEGREPVVGRPTPTLVDAGIGAVTLVVLGLGTLGLRRAPRWSRRRAAWPGWRFGLRLVPQLCVLGVGVLLFGIAPALEDNSLTARDVFLLYPAGAVLIAVATLVALALVVARTVARLRAPADPAPHSG